MIPLKSIQNIVDGYQLLEKDLASSNIDKKLFAAKSIEYSNISEIIKEARAYLNFEKNKIDLEKIINDEKSDKEMIELANSELEELLKQNNENEKKLKLFLLPKDEADKKNAIVEIRAGTGGLEASLFVADLYKMYQKVCLKKNGLLK